MKKYRNVHGIQKTAQYANDATYTASTYLDYNVPAFTTQQFNMSDD